MFDWEEFLAFAERLVERDVEEVALRTAISRAYYAVYHRASTYIRDNDLLPAGEGLTHRKVWDTLQAASERRRFDIGSRGRRLQRRRTSADYHNPYPGDIQDAARFSVNEARSMLDLIDPL